MASRQLLAGERPSDAGVGIGRPRAAAAAPRFGGRTSRRRPGIAFLVFGIAALTLTAVLAPGIVGGILDRLDYRRSVHTDRSAVASGVSPQAERRALVVYRDRDGRTVRALAGEAELGAFVRRELARLEAARAEARSEGTAGLERRTRDVFTTMHARVGEFADWYYGWTTPYKLTGKAVYSALANVVSPSVMRLDDAVAHDLERYVEKRYRDMVLRPEISDLLLRNAYVGTLRQAHARFLATLADFDERFQRFVAERTTYLDGALDERDIAVALDWDHQARKLSLSGLERGALEAGRGVALAGAGVVAGSRAGAAAARVAASRIAARGLAARLAGPYAARGVGAAAAAAVGASGGPVGALAGGTAALGLDVLINEGVELAGRDDFEARLHEGLTAQERHWQNVMQDSLANAVDVWYDDIVQVLAAYDGAR